MGRRIVGGMLLAMLALATPAAAADRYASTTGGAVEPCNPTPCNLATAAGAAAPAGSTVHVAAGTYSTQLSPGASGLTILGPATGPRAVVSTTASAAAVVSQPGTTLRNVDLTADTAFSDRVLAVTSAATSFLGERLRVTGVGSTGTGVLLNGAATTVLRDSFVSVPGANGVAVMTAGSGPTVVNVTARAAGSNATGLHASNDFSPGVDQNTRVVNSILLGALRDIVVDGDATDTVTVTVDHSQWNPSPFVDPPGSTVVDGGGNQTASPLFEADDVTQASGSPTINAGRTLAQLGTADLFGGARPSGSAPDIGAHEVQEAAPAGTDTTVGGSTTPTTTNNPPDAILPPPDRLPPAFVALAVSNRRFTVGREATALVAQRRTPRGTMFRWTLSEPASVTIVLERRLPGLRVRRAGRVRCLRATAELRRSLRGKRQRRCTVLRTAGALRRTAPAGAGSLRFSGRLGTKALPAGSYRATVVATDAVGNRSVPRRLSFTIVRR